jgi:hypothetical protein
MLSATEGSEKKPRHFSKRSDISSSSDSDGSLTKGRVQSIVDAKDLLEGPSWKDSLQAHGQPLWQGADGVTKARPIREEDAFDQASDRLRGGSAPLVGLDHGQSALKRVVVGASLLRPADTGAAIGEPRVEVAGFDESDTHARGPHFHAHGFQETLHRKLRCAVQTLEWQGNAPTDRRDDDKSAGALTAHPRQHGAADTEGPEKVCFEDRPRFVVLRILDSATDAETRAVDDGVNALCPFQEPFDRLANGVVGIYVHAENLETSLSRQFRVKLS